MLGVGFAPQIDRIKALLGLDYTKTTTTTTTGSKLQRKHADRAAVQVGLFTATMPAAMHALTSAWLNNPKKIALKSASSGASAGRAISATVVQVVQVCAEHKKPVKLMKHLESIKTATTGNRHAPKILIFSNRIKTVRFIFKLVLKANFRTVQLHGERSQEEREEAIKDFKSGKVQVLVASDVAARGLDVQNLPYVVNYDFPGNLDTYIHRVGRTGRLAADGHAFSFLTREMAPLAGSLLGLLREHDQSVDPNLVKLAHAYEIAAKRLGLSLSSNGSGKSSDAVTNNDGNEEHKKKEEENNDDVFRKKTNRPATEDILRELDMKTKAQKRKDKLVQAKQEKRKKKQKRVDEAAGKELSSEEEEKEENSFSDDDDDDSSLLSESDADVSEGDESDARKKGKKKAFAAVPARLEFLPCKKFSGARPGYVFKKGGMGVGFYLDHPPHKILKDLARARKQIAAKYAAKPVGGSSEKLKEKAGAGVATKAAVPLLPGKIKTLKRQQQEYPSSDEDGFGSSSGSESDSGKDHLHQKKAQNLNPTFVPIAQVSEQKKKRGALPGRLRKKLAKDRMKKAAAAAVSEKKEGGGRGVSKSL